MLFQSIQLRSDTELQTVNVSILLFSMILQLSSIWIPESSEQPLLYNHICALPAPFQIFFGFLLAHSILLHTSVPYWSPLNSSARTASFLETPMSFWFYNCQAICNSCLKMPFENISQNPSSGELRFLPWHILDFNFFISFHLSNPEKKKKRKKNSFILLMLPRGFFLEEKLAAESTLFQVSPLLPDFGRLAAKLSIYTNLQSVNQGITDVFYTYKIFKAHHSFEP